MVMGTNPVANRDETILSWQMGSKKILWFSELNKYLITTQPVDHLIRMVRMGAEADLTRAFCMTALEMNKSRARAFDLEIRKYLIDHLQAAGGPSAQPDRRNLIPANHSNGFITRNYNIYGVGFRFEFETEEIAELLHPKYAHLEIQTHADQAHQFMVYTRGSEYVLQINGEVKGSWKKVESHLMCGKFSMEIIQRIYGLEENKWMGVFHASAVTDGKNCILLLGNSGEGKSTSAAILMANGLEVLADDFLPVESETQLVCSFPAALSVKTSSYELLAPRFPELDKATEFHHATLNKVFRYLPPGLANPLRVPCKALVFIHFNREHDFIFKPMSQENAFQQLVPDSWISPEPSNAERFIRWFLRMPCYQMTYSNNDRMIQTINHILSRDL
jgi:hypothetical protein